MVVLTLLGYMASIDYFLACSTSWALPVTVMSVFLL